MYIKEHEQKWAKSGGEVPRRDMAGAENVE